MIFSKFLSRWTNPERKESSTEEIYAMGFDRGFELGLRMSSELDKEVKKKLKDDATSEAIERLNGNHS